ncbi:hypothetical protein SEA_KELCOLE_46 [Microbacterium phage Kelcole]|nr:hypothetical protein SEA_KELCOLE_46 [Microbacterium phage Kelcole]
MGLIPHINPAGEPTPTVAELYELRDGYAEVAKWTEGSKTEPPKPAVYRLTDKGHALLGEIMQRNAAATLSRGSGATDAVDSMKKFVRSAKQQEVKDKKGKGNGSKSKPSPS